MKHYEAWSSLRDQSRAFLTPWEPTWPPDDLGRGAFKRRVKRYRMRDNQTGLSYFLVRKSDQTLVGGITVSRMLRGVAQSCSIGYWVGEPFTRQGYMSEAVTGLYREIFETMQFHRIEAACLPNNDASIKLLEKIGFQREGYARGYLKIDGRWQDHLLYSLLETDYKSMKVLRES